MKRVLKVVAAGVSAVPGELLGWRDGRRRAAAEELALREMAPAVADVERNGLCTRHLAVIRSVAGVHAEVAERWERRLVCAHAPWATLLSATEHTLEWHRQQLTSARRELEELIEVDPYEPAFQLLAEIGEALALLSASTASLAALDDAAREVATTRMRSARARHEQGAAQLEAQLAVVTQRTAAVPAHELAAVDAIRKVDTFLWRCEGETYDADEAEYERRELLRDGASAPHVEQTYEPDEPSTPPSRAELEAYARRERDRPTHETDDDDPEPRDASWSSAYGSDDERPEERPLVEGKHGNHYLAPLSYDLDPALWPHLDPEEQADYFRRDHWDEHEGDGWDQ